MPHDITFPFGPDTNRELLVYINSISANPGSGPIRVAIYALLDSLVPDLWLPVEICEKIRDSFGLQYNSSINKYFINDTIHNNLSRSNTRLSFLLGGDAPDPNETVNVTVPYNSLSLIDKSPSLGIDPNGSRYFPLRQAENSSQYTIGRAFFQNAYVIADYERRNFSVHQAILPNLNTKQDIVTIQSLSANGTTDRKSKTPHTKEISNSVIAGIVVAVVTPILVAITTITWCRRETRIKKPCDDLASIVFNKPELGGSGQPHPEELSCSERPPPELSGRGWRGPELETGDIPPVVELPAQRN